MKNIVNYKGIELNMSKEMADRIILNCQKENFTERRTINALKREEKKIAVEKIHTPIKK